MNFISKEFKNRKYATITSSIIPFQDRITYLMPTERDNDSRVSFITTYDPTIPFRDSLLQDWSRLSSHPELRTIFTNPPRITYKRNTNLSQLLVRAKLDHYVNTNLASTSVSIQRPSSFPAKNISCRNEQCSTCPQLSHKSYYSSYQTKEYFSIPDIYSCDTTSAIYLLQCTICNKQYVGETHVTIRNRMKHHRNKAKTALNRPIYAHLQKHQADINIFSITIIDQVKDLQRRKEK